MGPQPVRTQRVDAGGKGALEDPRGPVLATEHVQTLFDRVSGGPRSPEPVGVPTPGRLGHGVQGPSVAPRQGPVRQRGEPKRACLAVAVRDLHAAYRLDAGAMRRACVDRREFLRRALPDRVLNTRWAFAWVFGHSSDGERCGATRVGPQVWQGLDSAPPAGLCGLYHTRLEPTHMAIDPIPVDLVPVGRTVRSCTSCPGSCHRLCRLHQLAQRSCQERAEGSQPACTAGNVVMDSTRISSMTEERSLPPASHPPRPIGRPCGLPTLRADVGLTLCRGLTRGG